MEEQSKRAWDLNPNPNSSIDNYVWHVLIASVEQQREEKRRKEKSSCHGMITEDCHEQRQ
jgi:hypothetical protein